MLWNRWFWKIQHKMHKIFEWNSLIVRTSWRRTKKKEKNVKKHNRERMPMWMVFFSCLFRTCMCFSGSGSLAFQKHFTIEHLSAFGCALVVHMFFFLFVQHFLDLNFEDLLWIYFRVQHRLSVIRKLSHCFKHSYSRTSLLHLTVINSLTMSVREQNMGSKKHTDKEKVSNGWNQIDSMECYLLCSSIIFEGKTSRTLIVTDIHICM